MEKIGALIVDDEPLAREGIRVLLGRDPDFEIVGECATGMQALQAVRDTSPGLMFLDVQMPQMNGFEVLSRISPGHMPVVVFVTAFDQYALRAFEYHALDYLLKPFDDERFKTALQRAKKQIQQRKAHQLSERMMALVEDYQEHSASGPGAPATDEPRYISRLSIRSAGRIFFIKTDEIDWIEAADYYVKLHVGGKAHLLRRTMTQMEEQLDPERFLRIHRSTIVNLEQVRELRSQGPGDYKVRLDDGTELRLSRGRKDRLSAVLDRSG